MVFCRNDGDCPGNLVCYENVTWSSKSSFCDCESLWFGWVGDKCLEFGPSTYFSVVTSSLYVFACAVLLLSSARLWLYQRMKKLKWTWNQTVEIYVVINFVIMAILALQTARVVERVLPAKMIEVEHDSLSGIYKSSNATKVHDLLAFVVTVLIVYVGSNLGMLWLEISFIASFTGYHTIRRLRNFFRCVKIYAIGVGVVGLAKPDLEFLCNTMLFAVYPVYIILFLTGKRMFLPLLMKVNSALGLKVRFLANAILTSLTGLILGNAILLIIFRSTNPRVFIKVGTMSSVLIVVEFNWIMILLGVSAIFRYIYQVAHTVHQETTKKTPGSSFELVESSRKELLTSIQQSL